MFSCDIIDNYILFNPMGSLLLSSENDIVVNNQPLDSNPRGFHDCFHLN